MSESATAYVTPASMSASTMCRDLSAEILRNLRTQPDHWMRMSQTQQSSAIGQINANVREMVNRAVGLLLKGSHPAVQAKLESVTFKDGIKATISADKLVVDRHSLADAEGSMVMVIMVSPEEYAERMDEVKAMSDQPDLFDGDYDPSKDQPAYRRDQPQSAPAGTSWAELMSKMKGGEISKEEAEKQYGGELPPEDPTPDFLDVKGQDLAGKGPLIGNIQMRWPIDLDDSLRAMHPGEWEDLQMPQVADDETIRESLAKSFPGAEFRFLVKETTPVPTGDDPAVDPLKVRAGLLLEMLTGIGMIISLGEVQALSQEQQDHAETWVAEWLAAGKKKPKRPHYLPAFTPKPKE